MTDVDDACQQWATRIALDDSEGGDRDDRATKPRGEGSTFDSKAWNVGAIFDFD